MHYCENPCGLCTVATPKRAVRCSENLRCVVRSDRCVVRREQIPTAEEWRLPLY